MTLTHRLLRRLGRDTTVELEHCEAVYEYIVTHLNGETSVQRGNEDRRDGAFLLIKDVPDVRFIRLSGGTLSPPFSYNSWDTVRRLEGIQEYEKEKVGEDVWTATFDKADRSLSDVSCEKVER